MKDDLASAPTAAVSNAIDVVGWTTEPGGMVHTLTATPPDSPALEYLFEDVVGDLHAVTPQTARRSTAGEVNLIAVSEEEPDWALETGGGVAKLGTNLSETWTLAGTETWYVGSSSREEPEGFSASAHMLDPITGSATPIRPLARYQFSLLTAAHRCQAQVKAMVLAADGRVLEEHAQDVDPRHRGGAQAAAYHEIRLDFLAPPAAASVRFSLRKGRTERRDDSFVFFVRPVLRALGGGEAPVGEPMRLSRNSLGRMRTAERVDVERAALAAPAALFQGRQSATAHLWVAAGADRRRVGPLALERRAGAVVTNFDLDGPWATFSGAAEAGEVAMRVGLFIDGRPGPVAEVGVVEGRFAGDFRIPPEHMDGRPHALELRSLPDQRSLARRAALLPAQLTPWTTVQALTRSPQDITASPLAGHHFRSFRAWAAAVADGRASASPELTRLHDELVQGYRKRSSYPPLVFPEVEAPAVSVVIPAHNKFEVTYHCLCSLLFAYNEASFEVVLVDDGSSDDTAAAESVVSGIRVVRHVAATGFVEACNDGAGQARGRYVCFLNNDTEVTAGWLDELVRAFEAFDGVGLAGSKLIYPDGSLQEAGGVVWRSGNPWNVGRKGNAADPAFNYLRQVDYVSGAAILLPADVWREVGGFSPEFAPGYFEDTDLAMKVRESGRRVVYVPSSTVVHFEGQSSGVSVSAGMKRFQEVNRPKFKKKWGPRLLSHAVEGENLAREKDRGVAFRVLFLDQRAPQVDNDAGSYAAFQEIRVLQSLGGKVTFLPRNLAWMDQHTAALQRIGVETLYAPFVLDFEAYVREHAAEYDMIYVNRYRIGEQVLAAARTAAPRTKIVLNLADLHFLRELREAEAGSADYTIEGARKTRASELAVVRGVDLTLSYTDVELAVLQSHTDGAARLARAPWVVEAEDRPRPAFEDTRDILFLGGFGHPPNIRAAQFFAKDVMPAVRERLPDAVFQIVGSHPTPEVTALTGEGVDVLGQVADLGPVFARSRLFVAPLLAGAGIKGKVLEAMARGSAMVLSPVAAEGTGLVDGTDCLIADTAEGWAEAVVRLYTDPALWTSLGDAARRAAASRFGFEAGARTMADALAKIDIFGAAGLHYTRARPDRPTA